MILDGHIHMNDAGGDLSKMMRDKHDAYRSAGFFGECLVCDTAAGVHGIPKNMLALLYKWLYPDEPIYVMAGLEYFIPGKEVNAHTFRKQAEELLAAGADGFKMYEGKPNARKQIGNRSLLDRSYEEYFSCLEERQIPVAIHLADPDHFWDPASCGEEIFRNGWFFGDSSYASAQTIRNEVFTLLEHHPRMKVIIPQLGFLTHQLDMMSSWMERFPELTLDLGPTPEFYADLEAPGGELKQFLRQYRDRVFFSCTGVCQDGTAVIKKAEKHKSVLEAVLPEVCDPIWSENFIRIFGKPRTVDQLQCLSLINETKGYLMACLAGITMYSNILIRLQQIEDLFCNGQKC